MDRILESNQSQSLIDLVKYQLSQKKHIYRYIKTNILFDIDKRLTKHLQSKVIYFFI
jgi:hypothetical protein